MFRLHFPALFVAAALLASAGAGPAARAPEGPVPSWRQSHFESGNTAVISLYVVALCARRENPEAAESLLRSAPDSQEERAAFERLVPASIVDPCLARIRFAWRNRRMLDSPVLFRGVIAETVYNGARIRPASATRPAAGAAERPASAAPRIVARCAVERSPMLAHQVLRFGYGSPGEERALRALDQTFLACLPEGAQLGVSRLVMRALLAEALLQAARAARESFVNA